MLPLVGAHVPALRVAPPDSEPLGAVLLTVGVVRERDLHDRVADADDGRHAVDLHLRHHARRLLRHGGDVDGVLLPVRHGGAALLAHGAGELVAELVVHGVLRVDEPIDALLVLIQGVARVDRVQARRPLAQRVGRGHRPGGAIGRHRVLPGCVLAEPRAWKAEAPDGDDLLLGEVLLVGLRGRERGALGDVHERAERLGGGRVGLGPLELAALVLLEVVADALEVLHHHLAAVELVALVEQREVLAQVVEVLVVGARRR